MKSDYKREIAIKNEIIDLIYFRCNAIIESEIENYLIYNGITDISNNSIDMIIHIIKRELKKGL